MHKIKRQQSFFRIIFLLVLLCNILPTLMTPVDFVFAEQPDLGATYIEKIGDVFHIWNNIDHYYINETGMQITNHFNEYWSNNVWGLRIKVGGTWYLRWAAGMSWTWVNTTDANHHWVELNGTAHYEEGIYNATFRVRYYLADSDKRIQVSLGLRNDGADIDDISFGWLTRDVQVGGDTANDQCEITLWADVTNHTKGWYQKFYNLNQSGTVSYDETEMALRQFSVYDALQESSLHFYWDEYGWKDYVQHNMSFLLFLDSTHLPAQDNGVALLYLNIGSFDNGQTAYTNFWWIDATTITNNPQTNDGDGLPTSWDDTADAYTDDANYASTSLKGCDSMFGGYDFDTNLPEDQFIDKVEVGIDYYSSQASDSILVRVTWDNGGTWSDDAEVYSANPTTEWIDATNVTDWTRAKLLDANLFVEIEMKFSAGGGCFAPSTMITLLNHSEIPISQGYEGMELLTYGDKVQTITTFTYYPDHKVVPFFVYDLSNGRTLTVAPHHKVVIDSNLHTKLTDDVEVGDTLLAPDDTVVTVEAVSIVYLTEFYNIVVSNKVLYTEGILIHNYVKEPWTVYVDWLPVRVTYSPLTEHEITYQFFTGCDTYYVNGSSKGNDTSGEYIYDTILNFTAVASSGYVFYNWTYVTDDPSSDTSTDNPFLLTVTANFTVRAYFLVQQCYAADVRTLVGSTGEGGGTFGDLLYDDESYYSLSSYNYRSAVDTTDYVDSDASDVDGVSNIGTHSDFTQQQSAPDSTYDTLTAGNTNYDVSLVEWSNGFIFPWDSDEWTFVGDDYPLYEASDGDYMYADNKGQEQYWFEFYNVVEPTETYWITSVYAYVYLDCGSENIEVWFDGDSSTTFNGNGYAWHNWNITQFVGGVWGNFNGLSLALKSIASGGWSGNVYADGAYVQINYTVVQHELEIEEQWTSADYDEANEYFCVNTGTLGTATLYAWVWDGSWNSLGSLSASQWNNFSVSTYLTASTFTVKFNTTTYYADAKTYQIDSTCLHVWSVAQNKVEVELEGDSDSDDWVQMRVYLDANLSQADVSVYYQVYNFTAGSYESSGESYLSYTSLADTDELKILNLTNTPTDFRNGTNYWRVKVSTNFTASHNWLGDWLSVCVYTYPSVAVTYDVTYYFYEGGTIIVDGSNRDNKTEIEYNPNDVANITAVASYSYVFRNHTYDSSSTTDNPFYLTVDQDYTVKTYFRYVFGCNYIGLNTTAAGAVVMFYSQWDDLNDTEGLDFFLVEHNSTGTPQNSSWSNSWVDTVWARSTTTLSETEGLEVAFRFYVNDTSGIEYASAICFFWTSAAIDVADTIRSVFLMFIPCLFFSLLYEFRNNESVRNSVDLNWAGIVAAGCWMLLGIAWFVLASTTYVVGVLWNGIGIFYIVRFMVSLIQMRSLDRRLGDDQF